jgi:hypothetical protein
MTASVPAGGRTVRHACTALAVLVAGCGMAGPVVPGPCDGVEPAAGFAEVDSAGILIRTTGCEEAARPLGWAVAAEPELHIGDGMKGGEFGFVRGVMSLPDGGVAVMDSRALEVRYFGPRGEYRGRRGGTGEGPGEFQTLRHVRRVVADSVVLYDNLNRRLTAFDVEGSGTPSTRLVAPPLPITPVGQAGDFFLYRRFVDPGNARGVVLQATMTFAWGHVDSVNPVTLQSFLVRTSYGVIDRRSGQFLGTRWLFAPYPAAAVSATGPVLTSGAEFEILVFDGAGRPASRLRVPRRRRAVSRADFDAYVAFRIEEADDDSMGVDRPRYLTTRRIWEAFADMPLPDSMRTYTELRVDSRGWIWAQLYDWDRRQPSLWMVFDTGGRARGTVELPPRLDVHEIGEDYVLGVVHDRMGVASVRRHRLTAERR